MSKKQKKEMGALYIGGNIFGHDSAVYLITPEDKDIIALSTERVTRVKHDKMLFFPALEKALAYKKIQGEKIQKVYLGHSFTSEKNTLFKLNEYELQKAERKHFSIKYVRDLEQARKDFKNYSTLKKIYSLSKTKAGLKILQDKIFDSLKLSKKYHIDEILKFELKKIFPNAEIHIEFFDHQLCHATAAFFTSPFKKALSISYDGWGDDFFSRTYLASAEEMNLFASSVCNRVTVSSSEYPNQINGSPAGIYAYVTHLLGFKPLSEEGKVEALAAYSEPNKELYNVFMQLFTLNKESHALECNIELAEKTISKEIMDTYIHSLSRETIAASVQKFIEDITHLYIEHLVKETGEKNICLSGGATANVIVNLDIFETITDKIHITPAMADDGTAQGAAILLLKKFGFTTEDLSWLQGERMPYNGTSYTQSEIIEAISDFENQVSYSIYTEDWPTKAATLITEGKVGAIFHGRMEWGPRALGNRSIVADPTRPEFRDKINKTIKKRPAFQPFCPSILAEEGERLFEKFYLNKHMTCAFRMKKEYWEKLPSAIHIDGTARAQFVTEEDNKHYYKLLKEVKKINGFGVLINTSFNKHGRTIVESPKDAIVDFLDTDMDYLFIEGILILRK